MRGKGREGGEEEGVKREGVKREGETEGGGERERERGETGRGGRGTEGGVTRNLLFLLQGIECSSFLCPPTPSLPPPKTAPSNSSRQAPGTPTLYTKVWPLNLPGALAPAVPSAQSAFSAARALPCPRAGWGGRPPWTHTPCPLHPAW